MFDLAKGYGFGLENLLATVSWICTGWGGAGRAGGRGGEEKEGT